MTGQAELADLVCCDKARGVLCLCTGVLETRQGMGTTVGHEQVVSWGVL
jgi:hypothetical protein